ncbi:MAG: hypothetical protein V4465_01505 [Patescibacteria group bacterium]
MSSMEMIDGLGVFSQENQTLVKLIVGEEGFADHFNYLSDFLGGRTVTGDMLMSRYYRDDEILRRKLIELRRPEISSHARDTLVLKALLVHLSGFLGCPMH